VNIAITGASGFVGRRLSQIASAHTFRPVSTRTPISPEAVAGCDAVVNLAGEPVTQRWTQAAREKILSSRIAGTRRLVDALRANPPAVLVSASAIGYYGSRGDEVLTEGSPPGDDFLARVAVEWEREALRAEEFGVRVVTVRIGVALGRGGALEKMLPFFKLGLGGRIGDGRQWMSWIHIDDLARLIVFALQHPVRGAINATAQNPVTNVEFTRTLGQVLHRPAVLPVPKFALRMLYGEMSQVIFASQKALPRAAEAAGFSFQYPRLDAALAEIKKGTFGRT
jgi:uncharacterized protein (TIGR01777 family)